MASVILDVDGAVARPISPLLGRMLSAASAAAAAATLLTIAALPHDLPSRAVASGPSILEEALAKQNLSLTLRLQLPVDLAAEVPMPSVDGISGPARPAPRLRSFRLRDSNEIVVVAMLPGAPAVVRPPIPLADELSVHGAYAANYSVEATSFSVLRWTEYGMTYEISSRGLLPGDLVRLAEQVR
jgi:hypothetical protein